MCVHHYHLTIYSKIINGLVLLSAPDLSCLLVGAPKCRALPGPPGLHFCCRMTMQGLCWKQIGLTWGPFKAVLLTPMNPLKPSSPPKSQSKITLKYYQNLAMLPCCPMFQKAIPFLSSHGSPLPTALHTRPTEHEKERPGISRLFRKLTELNPGATVL